MEKKRIISNERLYMMAGKAFAGYLNYPSFRKFLHTSTYFYVNLSENTLDECHLSEMIKRVITVDDTTSYDSLIGQILTYWKKGDADEDIKSFFDRENLIDIFHLGESFANADYSCQIKDDFYRKQIACQLEMKGDDVCALFLIYDITDLYDQTAAIRKRAEYDQLTDLYNKNAIESHIQTYFRQYPDEMAALVIVDVDNFKQFNDHYGHHIGDLVLRAASRSLERYLGENSLIGRNGGDEFLVLLKNTTIEKAAEQIGAFSKSRHALEHEGTLYEFSFSIGYAIYPDHGNVYSELMEKADQAMYQVKANGRAGYMQYSTDMEEQSSSKKISFNLMDVVSGVPGAIIIYRAEGERNILYANTELIEIMQCHTMDEFMAYTKEDYKNIISPSDVDAITQTVKKQLETKDDKQYFTKLTLVSAGGDEIPMCQISRLKSSRYYGDIVYSFLYRDMN